MGIVTVGAGHLLFPDRMVGEEAVLGFNLRMAAVAEFGGFLPGHLLARAPVELVAVEAANVVQGMDAAIPVCQGRRRGGRVALEADE